MASPAMAVGDTDAGTAVPMTDDGNPSSASPPPLEKAAEPSTTAAPSSAPSASADTPAAPAAPAVAPAEESKPKVDGTPPPAAPTGAPDPGVSKEILLSPSQAAVLNKKLKGYALVCVSDMRAAFQPSNLVTEKRSRKNQFADPNFEYTGPVSPTPRLPSPNGVASARGFDLRDTDSVQSGRPQRPNRGRRTADDNASVTSVSVSGRPKKGQRAKSKKSPHGGMPPPMPSGASNALAPTVSAAVADPNRALMMKTKLAVLQSRLAVLQQAKDAGANLSFQNVDSAQAPAVSLAPVAKPKKQRRTAPKPRASSNNGYGLPPAQLDYAAAAPPPPPPKRQQSAPRPRPSKAVSHTVDAPPYVAMQPHVPSVLIDRKAGDGNTAEVLQVDDKGAPAVQRSRSGRGVKKTNKHDASELEEPLKSCRTLVLKMLSEKGGNNFGVPVAVPGYTQVIPYPMDLGTIKTNLEQGRYATKEAVHNDVELVWQNAMRFNPPGHWCHELAKKLKTKFDNGMVTMEIKLREKEERLAAKKAAQLAGVGRGGYYPTSTTASGVPDPFGLPATPRQAAAQTAATELTFLEKQALKDDIFKLESDKLEHVVNIISENMPPGNEDDDEIEIDIDQLNVPTLRRLQAFVRQCLENVVPPLGPMMPESGVKRQREEASPGAGEHDGQKRRMLEESAAPAFGDPDAGMFRTDDDAAQPMDTTDTTAGTAAGGVQDSATSEVKVNADAWGGAWDAAAGDSDAKAAGQSEAANNGVAPMATTDSGVTDAAADKELWAQFQNKDEQRVQRERERLAEEQRLQREKEAAEQAARAEVEKAAEAEAARMRAAEETRLAEEAQKAELERQMNEQRLEAERRAREQNYVLKPEEVDKSTAPSSKFALGGSGTGGSMDALFSNGQN